GGRETRPPPRSEPPAARRTARASPAKQPSPPTERRRMPRVRPLRPGPARRSRWSRSRSRRLPDPSHPALRIPQRPGSERGRTTGRAVEKPPSVDVDDRVVTTGAGDHGTTGAGHRVQPAGHRAVGPNGLGSAHAAVTHVLGPDRFSELTRSDRRTHRHGVTVEVPGAAGVPSNRGTTRKAEPTSSPISTTITTVRTTTSGVDIPFFAGGQLRKKNLMSGP